MADYHVKALIIGAGVSGLSAARILGRDALILEKEAEPGGYCRSIRRNGFIWDWSGHFFHFRDEGQKQSFLNRFAPGELQLCKKDSRVLFKGALVHAPFQDNLHELPRADMLDCLADLLCSENGHASYASFLDMLYARYGAATTERFLRPYNEKLYACPLNTLDAGAMGRFFPGADRRQLAANMRGAHSKSYNSRFYYPLHGAAAFIESLCRELPAGALRLSRSLCALDTNAHIALDSAGDRYHYERLINTAALPRFLSFLGEEERRFAATLSWNKVLVFNLGFAQKALCRGAHWLYVPQRDAPFYRVGFYDNILGSDRASLYVEIGFPSKTEPDVREALRNTLEALQKLGIIQPGNDLLDYEVILMDPAYVHLQPGTEEAVRRLRERLSSRGLYSIGRYGAWCYHSIEDCVREAEALAISLKGGAQL